MWRFRKLELGEPERNPRESEFFRLKEPAEAVVREVIQNSLDARSDNASTVKVCFSFGEVGKVNVGSYFQGLEPHLIACDLLLSDCTDRDKIPFLVIEDFGTTGLDGATAVSYTHLTLPTIYSV